ncbi:BglG family transcription antiterminator [Thermoanaerobacter pentosaceus]|uniref:Transcriptional antiterminator n=1 Tax=Thermoanaerobacter pentosaceus TaxID=694059 RepID=A0ABT9M404_9THEO|nr:BglG family transcription antiterminator [Thermoanaerobacter pentosaceus]MDP9750859.1 transcriptional antiterminator [Thermoanaerobacter pentosaceus]
MDRILEIINMLLNSEKPLTVDYIANRLKVSNKTIRNDLKKVEEYVQQKGVKIIKKPRVGILLEGPRNKRLELADEIKKSLDFEEPFSPETRKNYILKRLFMSKGSVTIKELAEELYVSRVTIHKDLRNVEKWLNKFNLKLLKKPNYGIEVVGDEENWRNAVASLIVSTKEQKELKEFLYNDYTGRIDYRTLVQLKELFDIDYKQLEKIVSNAESKLKFRFSDEAFISLVIHVAISIERLKHKKDVKLSKAVLNNLKQKDEYVIAQQMAKEIETKFNVVLPESEIGYIVLHIIGTKMQQNKTEDVNLELEDEESIELAVIMSKEIINIAERALCIDLSNDKQLLNGLILHLRPTINRLKYGLTLRNPLLNDIKENYPEIYGVAWMTSVVFEKYLGKKVAEEEIGYIALHLGAAVERAKKPLRALVVCTTGIGTAQLLVARLEKSFKQIEIKDIISSVSLHESILNDIDIVISTVPIEINKPFINISPLLTQNDIKRLDEFIESLTKKSNLIETQLIEVDDIYLQKDDLLSKVCMELSKKGYVKDEYLEDVITREKIASTAIGNGIAIPHGLPEHVNKSVFTVVRLKNPMVWDEEKVDMLFMIALTQRDIGKARYIFRKLYNKLESSEFVESIKKAKNKEEIIKLLEVIYDADK